MNEICTHDQPNQIINIVTIIVTSLEAKRSEKEYREVSRYTSHLHFIFFLNLSSLKVAYRKNIFIPDTRYICMGKQLNLRIYTWIRPV